MGEEIGMAQWEYEIRKIDPTWETDSPGAVPDTAEIVESFFNGMGEMEWEFVGFLPHISLAKSSVGPLEPSAYYAIFKKLKEE
jgi:hypothetical protein